MRAAVGVVLLWTLLLPPVAQAEGRPVAEGEEAPMFRLPVYARSGSADFRVSLDRWVGHDRSDEAVKGLLVSFMASFCSPCKKELPYLQSLQERYGSRGLRILSVAIDRSPEGQKEIDALISKHRLTFPVAKDRYNLVARRWLGAATPLPSVFLVKADGTVWKVHRGYSEDAARLLDAEVGELLGIPAETAKP